jgi:plastocyanin
MSRSLRLGGSAGLAVSLLVLGACGGSADRPTDPTPTRPDTLDVFTPGNVFSPTSAEIGRGGTIRYRLSESPDGRGHNVVFTGGVAGAPPGIPVLKDTTVARTFTQQGTFPYSCTVHPGMDGDVIVK